MKKVCFFCIFLLCAGIFSCFTKKQTIKTTREGFIDNSTLQVRALACPPSALEGKNQRVAAAKKSAIKNAHKLVIERMISSHAAAGLERSRNYMQYHRNEAIKIKNKLGAILASGTIAATYPENDDCVTILFQISHPCLKQIIQRYATNGIMTTSCGKQ